MTVPRRVFSSRATRLILFLTLLLCGSAACNLNEFRVQEQKLKPLVEKRAERAEVVALLGDNYIMYSEGRTNWEHLTMFLAREPTNRLVAVRKKVAEWPNLMLYSTPEMMTWIFLDRNDRVVDFVVGAQ